MSRAKGSKYETYHDSEGEGDIFRGTPRERRYYDNLLDLRPTTLEKELYVPDHPNQTAFDFFTVDTNQFFIFQVTALKSYRVLPKGLEQLDGWCKLRSFEGQWNYSCYGKTATKEDPGHSKLSEWNPEFISCDTYLMANLLRPPPNQLSRAFRRLGSLSDGRRSPGRKCTSSSLGGINVRRRRMREGTYSCYGKTTDAKEDPGHSELGE